MPPLSLLIKPASGNCNLRCGYCFYHDVSAHRTTPSYGMMSLGTLETLVRKALAFADGSCTFAFQGGEPTLAGLDFYRTLVRLADQYNEKKVDVHYAIQTNGMVVDEEWARFFHDHHFLVGLSLDGPKDLHDVQRVDAAGTGSWRRAMEAARQMEAAHADFNILTVVTNPVARHVRQVYAFLKKSGFRYLQFIPCLDPLDAPGGEDGTALTAERYAYFLKELFDLWYADLVRGDAISTDPVSIRDFENWVGMCAGRRPEACGMSGACQCQFVVEADGSVYPCDFYVIDQYRIGSIADDGFAEMAASENARRFIAESLPVDEACHGCEWYPICRGGCRRNREPFTAGQPGLNRFCEAYRAFFPYALPRMRELARRFVRG